MVARPQTARPSYNDATKKPIEWDIDTAIKKKAPNNPNQIKHLDNLDFIKKREPKTMDEIERNLWKNNITFTPR